jgi:hypothetical protein
MNLKRIVPANRQLALLSLLSATVIWLFVALETVDEMTVPLAVRFENAKPESKLQGLPVPTCSLRISGPRTLLLRQRWLGTELTVDLAATPAGRVQITDLGKRIRLVPGVNLLSATPGSLEFSLDKDNR